MDRRTDIMDALAKNLTRSVAFFQSLTADQLATPVYQDGARWTAKQVLAHFITIEGSMQWLFNDILSGGQGSPENFDVDRFNLRQTQKLDGLPLTELLARFKAVRQKTIAIVSGMSENDLDRQGRHAFHGHGTLERFIRWAYEHERIHETEIRKALPPS